MKIVRVILLIVNVLAALALVATTLAGTVSPEQSVLPSLLAFGYLPMLALNVLLVLVWMAMGRWEFLLSVAAIAVRWSMVGMYIQVGGTSTVPDRDAHPDMVTLMTYNVHQFKGSDVEATPSDDNAALFLELVRKHKPDVLCMQEFAAAKTLHVTDSLLLLGYNHYSGTHTSKSGVPYGTVVFSRLPITYVKAIDGEKLLVELLHGEQGRFRVCCLHMDSYRFDDADREEISRLRHGEVDSTSRRTARKVKETILTHQREWEEQVEPVVTGSSLPLVVAGDLNDIPSSWLYSRMRQNMKDTYQECGIGFGTTYNGGFPKFRIDAVFHSDGIRTLSHKRIRSRMSDHHPVLVALEIEN